MRYLSLFIAWVKMVLKEDEWFSQRCGSKGI